MRNGLAILPNTPRELANTRRLTPGADIRRTSLPETGALRGDHRAWIIARELVGSSNFSRAAMKIPA
jgi:hypothetical protein